MKLCMADILCVLQIYCVCCRYIVCAADILCVLQIYCVCCRYIVCAEDILCVLQIYCVCCRYIVCAADILCVLLAVWSADRSTLRAACPIVPSEPVDMSHNQFPPPSNVVNSPTSILTYELLNFCSSLRSCAACGSPCVLVLVGLPVCS
jgi:hypothetical protein